MNIGTRRNHAHSKVRQRVSIPREYNQSLKRRGQVESTRSAEARPKSPYASLVAFIEAFFCSLLGRKLLAILWSRCKFVKVGFFGISRCQMPLIPRRLPR
jgi:hypothetical protein